MNRRAKTISKMLASAMIACSLFAISSFGHAQCTPIIDQEQNASTLANFTSISGSVCYLGNAVQSFIPTYDNVTAIGVQLGSVYAYGVDYKVGIFDELPNTGVDPIAESFVSVEGPAWSLWVIASFGRIPVTPGIPYYFGFCHAGGQIAYIEGSHYDPYPDGTLYGLGGNLVFEDYEITFQTFSNPCPRLDVDIDIKPGSYPNSVNLCSKGSVPVAIFGSSEFDVTQIDVDSLTLADADVRIVGKSAKSLCRDELVNEDAYADKLCQFDTIELALDADADTTAELNGKLFDDSYIFGVDSIVLVKDCQ